MSIEDKTPIYNLLRLQLENEKLTTLVQKCKENIELIKHCVIESLTVISQLSESLSETHNNNFQKDKLLLLLQMLETEIMMSDEVLNEIIEKESAPLTEKKKS